MVDKLSRGYARGLNIALRAPVAVVIFGVAVMVVAYVAMKQLKQEMVPSQDQSRLQIRLNAEIGADLNETNRLTLTAEAKLSKHPEIIGIQTTVSVGSSSMQVTMVDPKQRSMTQLQLSDTIRTELKQIAGACAASRSSTCRSRASPAAEGNPIEFHRARRRLARR